MYIPKSKLDPQIYYTPGGEYYYSTTRNIYEGYYHKDLNGKAYTGKEHTVESILLYPVYTLNPIDPDLNYYDGISNAYGSLDTSNTSYSVPVPQNDSLPPTQQEYEQSFYTRYILQYKLSKDPVFAEVNKTTYYGFFNNFTYKKYFNFAEIPWKISGPLYDIKQDNVLVEGGIIDSNMRSREMASKIMPGVENYLVDLTLYSKT